ncbi:MAG: hypothetical protein K2I08_10135 [Muribaculaceae bacterium]|nr:hypothetical protein [Muribaculaceae bacterium]
MNSSLAEEGALRVTYTKRILIKDVNISVNLRFDEVKADSVTIIYDGAGGWYTSILIRYWSLKVLDRSGNHI